MIPYYIWIFFPLLICLLERRGMYLKKIDGEKVRVESLSIISFFYIFIIILALRGIGCGIDLDNYQYYFNRYSSMNWSQVISTNGQYDVELGFRLFNKFISCFTSNFQIYIAIVAVISVIPQLKLYKEECEKNALTIIMFIGIVPYSLYFSGLRQTMAMGFVYPAFYFTKKKKIIPFLICVFIASLFHASAFIIILLYPIYRANITKNWLYVIVPLMTLIFVFNKQIFSFLLVFLSDTRYESYSIGATGAYGMLLLFVLISIVIIVFTAKNNNELNNDDVGLRNILLLCTCLQFFAPLSHVAMRMNYYYMIFLPFSISKLIDRFNESHKQVGYLLQILLSVLFLARFFIEMYKGADVLQIFPYIPFWRN